MYDGTASNPIGDLAETFCKAALGRFYNRSYSYFSTVLLGEKFEAVDIYGQLMGLRGELMPYYFFIQVKGTTTGYTVRQNRLKVKVLESDLRKIRALTAPTYIVGVDLLTERCYIASANDDCPSHFPSLPTTYLVDMRNIEDLWLEVRDFWEANQNRLATSRFSV
jgi:hypothetical protein